MSYKSVNPAIGEVLMAFSEHTDQEMFDAVSRSTSTSMRKIYSCATIPPTSSPMTCSGHS